MEFAYLGLDWTNGCIAVSNAEMDEIWQLVSDGTPIRILP
jgi:L,D-peptidoglycan transpeptidase YkuD (ErfK/YbiS/YcfS/YnhG family)